MTTCAACGKQIVGQHYTPRAPDGEVLAVHVECMAGVLDGTSTLRAPGRIVSVVPRSAVVEKSDDDR